MSGTHEILNKVARKYHELRQRNPHEQDGRKMWSIAKQIVQADLLADWLMFKQNVGLGDK